MSAMQPFFLVAVIAAIIPIFIVLEHAPNSCGKHLQENLQLNTNGLPMARENTLHVSVTTASENLN